MTDEMQAWLDWLDESPPIGECEGTFGPDPSPRRDTEKRIDEERFITHEIDMLSDADIKKLPPAKEDYRDAPDF